jgi:integrase/recombinase XerC
MLPEIERFGEWLECGNPRASTHVHYTGDLRCFLAWAGKPPSAITLRDVDAYVEHCRGLGHAVATVNRRLAAIRSFYRFLDLEANDAPPNPVRPRRHFIRQRRRLPQDAEDTDVERLFAAITAARDRAMFLLMLRCGLHVGQVRGLSVGNLQLQPTRGDPPFLWMGDEDGRRRVVYLSPQALAALNRWLTVRPAVEDEAVFLSHLGRRLTVSGIQDRLAHYCRRAGVWITCRQLRHAFARHLVEAGVPVTSIRRLLGHAHIHTTRLYLRMSHRRVQADYETAMARIVRQLSPAGSPR